MIIGTYMPGTDAHHSSISQSLYACTQRSASSLSSDLRKVTPANRGKVGKHTLAADAVGEQVLAPAATGS